MFILTAGLGSKWNVRFEAKSYGSLAFVPDLFTAKLTCSGRKSLGIRWAPLYKDKYLVRRGSGRNRISRTGILRVGAYCALQARRYGLIASMALMKSPARLPTCGAFSLMDLNHVIFSTRSGSPEPTLAELRCSKSRSEGPEAIHGCDAQPVELARE